MSITFDEKWFLQVVMPSDSPKDLDCTSFGNAILSDSLLFQLDFPWLAVFEGANREVIEMGLLQL